LAEENSSGAAPAAQNDRLQKQILIEQRITNEGKSLVAAYIIWWFFGIFGGHRFYLRQTGTAIAMLIIGLTMVGLCVTAIWAIVDAFLIPGMVRENNDRLRRELERQMG